MRRLVPLALTLCVAALATPRALAAQNPAPPDSARTDSTRSDSARSPIHPIHPAAAGYVYLAIFAAPIAAFVPTPLALIGPKGASEMAFLRDHEAWYASVGGRFAKGQTWANAVALESVRGDLHSELLVEDHWRPTHVRYATLRGGWLWHPTRYTATGFTLGYVHSAGDPSQRGAEVGLPLYLGGSEFTTRLEPTYVASPDGALWSYRLQVEGTVVPHSRFFVGAAATWKSLPLTSESRHDFAAQAVSILVGTRLP